MTRRAWGRILQVIGVGVVLLFLYRYLAANWAAVRRSGDALDLHAGSLALAAIIILGTYAILIAAWDAVLRGWGERLSYRAAIRIWCLSNLARYVPGRVWQIAGMAAMAQQAGVSPWAAAGSSVAVQLLNIATGTIVTVLFAPDFAHPLLIAVAGLVTAGAALALAWPRGASLASRALSALTGRSIQLRAVRLLPLLLSALITAVAWALYGLALALCVRGLTGRDINLTRAIGVFTGSYVAGLIYVLTPAGLGVREGILVNWLSGPLGLAAALVVTAGSRLLMTGTELVAAAVALPLTEQRGDDHKA